MRFCDFPNAQNLWEKVYFETVIVCRGGCEGGGDKVVHVFKWGFENFGKDYKTSPGSGGVTDGLETYSEVSQPFKDTLAHCYPGYKIC